MVFTGLDIVSVSSTTTAVTLKSAARRTFGSAQGVQVRHRLQVVDRGQQPLEIGPLVLERRLVQLEIPLLDRRARITCRPTPRSPPSGG